MSLSLFLFFFQHLLEKLKEAEESQSSLQAECEQYRTVLAETVRPRPPGTRTPSPAGMPAAWLTSLGLSLMSFQEGMLKDLQNSVEEEELVWKAKMAESEEQFRIVRSPSSCLAVSVSVVLPLL